MLSVRITTVAIALVLVPNVVGAQSFFLNFDIPYLVYDIEEYADGIWFYSELDNYPEMYGFSLAATTTVQFAIDALDHTNRAPGISGILVADRGQEGVREVGRFLAGSASWEVFRDLRTRMEYKTGPELVRELGPGDYRIEISTPTNEGRYVLKLGPAETPDSDGYVAALREIRAVQDFHGFGGLHMFRTSHVYLPILILFILSGIASTYWYARQRRLV